MKVISLRSEFDSFFVNMALHTDLLVKIMKSKGIELSPDEKTQILPKILPAEKKQIHEAFVLKLCVTWEILAENVFVECLLHDASEYTKRTGIVLPRKNLTKDICRGLISGLGYFDFKDAADLKGKAKRFLAKRYNPFNEIPKDAASKINEFYMIRNFIAHRSNSAKQTLKRMFKQKYNMRFRSPGNFLFDKVEFIESGEKGEEIRFANYSKAFEKAADKMAVFLEAY